MIPPTVEPDEEQALLHQLLSRHDLTEVPVEQLTEALRGARAHQTQLREFIGRTAAALNSDGMSYAAMSRLTGIPTSTLQHLATKFG